MRIVSKQFYLTVVLNIVKMNPEKRKNYEGET